MPLKVLKASLQSVMFLFEILFYCYNYFNLSVVPKLQILVKIGLLCKKIKKPRH